MTVKLVIHTTVIQK